MCISSSRPPAPVPVPPPPPAPPMLEQIEPKRADTSKSKTKRDKKGNKDYRYTPNSGGHLGTNTGSHIAGIDPKS